MLEWWFYTSENLSWRFIVFKRCTEIFLVQLVFLFQKFVDSMIILIKPVIMFPLHEAKNYDSCLVNLSPELIPCAVKLLILKCLLKFFLYMKVQEFWYINTFGDFHSLRARLMHNVEFQFGMHRFVIGTTLCTIHDCYSAHIL